MTAWCRVMPRICIQQLPHFDTNQITRSPDTKRLCFLITITEWIVNSVVAGTLVSSGGFSEANEQFEASIKMSQLFVHNREAHGDLQSTSHISAQHRHSLNIYIAFSCHINLLDIRLWVMTTFPKTVTY
jgi:hypothetical protein